MTGQVDFYVLESSAVRQRWEFACRLVEKAYLDARKVVVLAAADADAHALDELLWTFDERAFVPHELLGIEAADSAAPVLLTADPERAPPADLLVNLSGRLPPALQRYGRVVEIVDADAEWRRLGRERFKSYRDLNLPLATHHSATHHSG